MIIPIKFKKLYPDMELPQYATDGSAGFDIKAMNFKRIYDSEDIGDPLQQGVDFYPDTMPQEIQLKPFSRVLIGTGFELAIPKGYELQIRPRSGLALKNGLTVLNTPGTIDSDYRNEVGVIIFNSTRFIQTIKLGERIAQGVINETPHAYFEVVAELPSTDRTGGFGSTGK